MKENHILGLFCVRCGREHTLAPNACALCGGNLEVVYDYRRLKKDVSRKKLGQGRGLQRYLPLLPVGGLGGLLEVGGTPLLRASRLGPELGLSHLWLKDDGRNPSASFKDRAGVVVLARALEAGEKTIAGASTGNAASSLACLAAGQKIRTVIFVPKAAPQAKIAQILVYGATVVTVRGTYDDAFDLCGKACEEYGWYNRNTGTNPFTREGKKTASYEIVEQLGWRVPDLVFVPVGDGNILSGVWKGFKDFFSLGLIGRLPRLVAVQASGSDAVKRYFETGRLKPVSGKTLADSISVSLPRDGDAAVNALNESNGFAVSVADKDILAAMKTLARCEGIFAEPAGAAAVAGIRKAIARKLIKGGERIVALVTGSGLKDVKSAMKAVGEPYAVDPDFAEFKKLARRRRIQ